MLKQGQMWTLDFTLSILVFTLSMVLFFTFVSNQNNLESVTLTEATSDARSIGTLLVSQGFPTNWSESNVIIPGLTNGNFAIQDDKWDELETIESTNPNIFKALLNTRFNVWIQLQEKDRTIIKQIGTAPVSNTITVQNTRLITYNDTISRLQVVVWQ